MAAVVGNKRLTDPFDTHLFLSGEARQYGKDGATFYGVEEVDRCRKASDRGLV